jgi:hypothetical protein
VLRSRSPIPAAIAARTSSWLVSAWCIVAPTSSASARIRSRSLRDEIEAERDRGFVGALVGSAFVQDGRRRRRAALDGSRLELREDGRVAGEMGDIGVQLGEERERAHISQRELSRRLGVSASLIS